MGYCLTQEDAMADTEEKKLRIDKVQQKLKRPRVDPTPQPVEEKVTQNVNEENKSDVDSDDKTRQEQV